MGKGRHRGNSAQSNLRVVNTTTKTATPTSTTTPGYTKVPVVAAAPVVARRTEVTTPYKPVLILTDSFVSKVNYLHTNVARGIEWSAILLYTNKQGSVDDAANWVISVDDLILMDIGTSGYTEYDMTADDETNDIWMDHLEKGGKMGHIHTHHNMGCFFSGTDTGELHDNAPNHNYYLSLIVNYQPMANWIAKIAICGTESTEGTLTTTKSWRGAKGIMSKKETDSLNTTKEMLYLMNCTLVPESDTHVPVGLQSRIDAIKKSKVTVPTTTYGFSTGANTGKWSGSNAATPGVNYSSGVVAKGDGTYQRHTTPVRPAVPYSSPGVASQLDLLDDEEFGVVYDTNGVPMTALNSGTNSKVKDNSIAMKFSPKVVEPILAEILMLDSKTTKTIEQCVMTLEMLLDEELEMYIEKCCDVFVDIVDSHFPEVLTAIHYHAIVVSMYYILDPFTVFTAFEPIDTMLTEFLMEEGEFNPTMIKTMTGIAIDDQVCLERTVVEGEAVD